MKVKAAITAAFQSGVYTTRNTYDVSEFFIDSALDTDTDSFQITIGDFPNDFTALLHRDSEVRVSLFVEGNGAGNFKALQTGLADEVGWTDEGTLIVNGRDFTCVAVDSKHPPQRYTSARPEKIVAKEAAEIGIGANLRLGDTKQWPVFKQLATDGSESYWQFWYRLYRKRRMWLWAEPDGALVASILNYTQKPTYYFGDNYGLAKKYDKIDFIPVEAMSWRANKQQRVYQVYVVGNRGDKTSFVQKAIDPTMKHWIKKPNAIITSQSAHGPGEARAEAFEELFESKVGATEISLTIADPGLIVRQNTMAFVNISDANVRGDFYVVGSRIVGSVDQGFFQEVRLREQNYAISRRVPTDPKLIQGPGHDAMYGPTGPGGYGPNNPSGTISEAVSQAIGKNWGEYFVSAADKQRGPWPFALFLGTLVSIAKHETNFRNIRYNGMSGPDYPGTKDGHVPSIMTENAAYQEFVHRYANEPKYGRIAAPPGFSQWAVGPMQLYTPSYKEYADKAAGTAIDELVGGRWQPRYNILAGAFALRSKLSGLESALDPTNASQAYSLIWQGVTAYGASTQYMSEIKEIYDTTFGPLSQEAVKQSQTLNKDNDSMLVPSGTNAELLSMMLNNKHISYRSKGNTDDLKLGIVSTTLQKAMLAFANAGFDGLVWVFKTGHDPTTSLGKPSAHWVGRAVDYGNFRLGDSTHKAAQKWWCDHAVKLGVKQVIGPDDNLCYDSRAGFGTAAANWYGSFTLGEHDNHIHIGV